MSPAVAAVLWDCLSPQSRSVVLARLGVFGPRSAARLSFAALTPDLRTRVAGVMRASDEGLS